MQKRYITYLACLPGVTYNIYLKGAQPANVLKENIKKYPGVSACQLPAFIRAQNKTQQYLWFFEITTL